MAYVDLVQAQPVFTSGGATYNWAYDTPIAADGSPNITHLGINIQFVTAAALGAAPAEGLADIITSLRVKVGSTVIMNWNNNATKVAGATAMSQFGVLIQRIGGNNFIKQNNLGAAPFNTIGECSWPVGLDATRSHRVNIQMTLDSELVALGGTAATAATAINTIHYYGTSTEATIVGSRQDFTMTANATRTVTVYGKAGWNMLGLMLCDNDTTGAPAASQIADLLTEARVNNGAFREVSPDQWRAYNNSWGNPDRTSLTLGGKPDNGAAGLLASSVGGNMGGQAATLFMNLRRLTAGANIDLALTYGATGSTLALYPVWVAPVGRQTASPPKQTTTPVVAQTAIVESGTQS